MSNTIINPVTIIQSGGGGIDTSKAQTLPYSWPINISPTAGPFWQNCVTTEGITIPPPFTELTSADTWEIQIAFITGFGISSAYTPALFGPKNSGVTKDYIMIDTSWSYKKLNALIYPNGVETWLQGTTQLSPSNIHYARLSYTGSKYKLEYSSDKGQTWNLEDELASSEAVSLDPGIIGNNMWSLGASRNNGYKLLWGAIDFEHTYFKKNGQIVWGIT